jgi:hypothetical protein
MKAHSMISLTVLSAISFTISIGAQDAGSPWPVRAEIPSPALTEDSFGSRLAALADLDGDGRSEVLIGPWEVADISWFGVFSSRNGARIRDHSFPSAGLVFHSDFVAAVDDVDLDGTADYVICADETEVGGIQGAGSVYLFSGTTGALLMRLDGTHVDQEFGSSVAGVGDVNLDGVPDLAIAADGSLDAVYLCSGIDGSVLYSISAPPGSSWYGRIIDDIDDLDGDGIRELLVGAPASDVGGFNNNGFVDIYSGADGSLLRSHSGEGSLHYFGWDLSAVRDVNNDGFMDYLVGAHRALGNWGAVYLYSGETGQILQRFDGHTGGFFGDQVADAGDLDGDGTTDFLVGCENAFGYAGEFWALSGATGAVLSRLTAEPGGKSLGFGILGFGLGDQDGDGKDDVVVADVSHAGISRVRLLAGFKPELTSSATTLSMSAGGTANMMIDFPEEFAGRPYRLLASPKWGVAIARGRAFALGKHELIEEILNTGFIPWTTGHVGNLDAQGDASVATVVPPGSTSSFIGSTLYAVAVLVPQSYPRAASRGTSAIGIQIAP